MLDELPVTVAHCARRPAALVRVVREMPDDERCGASDRPVNNPARLTPSKLSGTGSPAQSSRVGSQSVLTTGASTTRPAGTWPGQRTMSGTRKPPSYRNPFPARYGVLCVIRCVRQFRHVQPAIVGGEDHDRVAGQFPVHRAGATTGPPCRRASRSRRHRRVRTPTWLADTTVALGRIGDVGRVVCQVEKERMVAIRCDELLRLCGQVVFSFAALRWRTVS